MTEVDIIDENLVYVPLNRTATIDRLTRFGYVDSGKVTFKDEFGTEVLMVGLKFNVLWREPTLGEHLICAICGNDENSGIIDDDWMVRYNNMTTEQKLKMFDHDIGRFHGYDNCENTDDRL